MNEGIKTCGKPSRGRYVQGCRCFACRVANAEYSYEQSHRSPYDRSTAMVGSASVSKARNRVRGWLDEGHSLRGVARATGVSRSALRTLMEGRHPHARTRGGKPIMPKRMSRANYEAIMRCDIGRGAKAPGSLVDAAPLAEAVAWLTAHGVSRADIARESGVSPVTVYQIGKRDRCEQRTMEAVGRACLRLRKARTA